jgi:hypothetical protein
MAISRSKIHHPAAVRLDTTAKFFQPAKVQNTLPMRFVPAFAIVCVVLHVLASSQAAVENGFVALFNERDLTGWQLMHPKGSGYIVRDGVLVCPADGGGNLFTAKPYADFILRFQFKLTPGANNGIGIRAPLEGPAHYVGMEIQVLDDSAPQYATLRPAQYHGSVYDVVPAKRGALKPPGEWNDEEIACIGRNIKVTLNGQVIVDTNLNHVHEEAALQSHPGLLRESGHIGFLGHDTHVEFRNIRVKEIPVSEMDNSPPPGFIALYNGRDLSGWRGLIAPPYDNPLKRARLAPEERAVAQAKADERMRAHWRSEAGMLVYDGQGDSLCTRRDDYANFELLVDWKIPEKGDSGIYLRGCPQVQIWDPDRSPYNPKRVGSGGLYNNKKNPSDPLKRADEPVGEWNRFRILMAGGKVHVFLNGELVVNNLTLENYWDYNQPIPSMGQVELQNHGDQLFFKNIYLREIPKP